jgi:hypothetical protein
LGPGQRIPSKTRPRARSGAGLFFGLSHRDLRGACAAGPTGPKRPPGPTQTNITTPVAWNLFHAGNLRITCRPRPLFCAAACGLKSTRRLVRLGRDDCGDSTRGQAGEPGSANQGTDAEFRVVHHPQIVAPPLWQPRPQSRIAPQSGVDRPLRGLIQSPWCADGRRKPWIDTPMGADTTYTESSTRRVGRSGSSSCCDPHLTFSAPPQTRRCRPPVVHLR